MPADSLPSANNTTPEQILSSSPGGSSTSSTSRVRTDSESSEKTMKFLVPGLNGGPGQVLTLDEVANVFEDIQKMELAHEIALNPDFKLQPHEPTENSLEQRIKKIMHEVFWDVLREEINSSPPNFDHAIQLLSEIKQYFPQILTQNNERTLNHINEVLDETVIRQQAEQGVLDFKSYANFIIDIMAKSCAPVRDEAVAKLRTVDDIVDTFKGILDTMTLMKIDMVNYLLDKTRNEILLNSAEFERQKFKKYLEFYKLGFPATDNWLKSNKAEGDIKLPAVAQKSIVNGYWALMDWEENDDKFPEVLYMDKERILKLSRRAQRLCLCGCLISICSAIPIIANRPDNRKTLAQQFPILLQNVMSESEIPGALENIWIHIKTTVNELLEKEMQTTLDANAEELLKGQILALKNKQSQVRQLMWERLKKYFNACMLTSVGQLPAPAGYTDYANELGAFATAMKRIVAYNHSIFGEYFLKVLNDTENTVTATPAPTQ